MLAIGLTGSLGTGKSTVANMFAGLGAQIIDADAITHELLQSKGPCLRAVVRAFGKAVVQNGKIDRKKLGELVFDDPRQLRTLNRIIHPAVMRETKREMAAYYKTNKNGIVMIDAPLLIEVGLDRWVDYVVVVKSTLPQQIDRVIGRLGITRGQALKRIRAQMPLREKMQRADIIIDNRKSLKETKKQVKLIWEKLSKKNQKI